MSKIEWTEATLEATGGCTECSPGCEHCFARLFIWRLAHNPVCGDKYKGLVEKVNGKLRWTGKIVFFPEHLEAALKRKKPTMYFVDSRADLFHPSVPFEFIAQVYAVAALCQQHTLQILTKRIRRVQFFEEWIKSKWPQTFGKCDVNWPMDSNVVLQFSELDPEIVCSDEDAPEWPLPNLWLGATVCNPDEKHKIDTLRQIPAAVRFISIEPCLADMGELDLTGIHWVIVGGESGPGARPMHPDGARSVRDQCKAAGVPFFFKQWGKHLPESQYQSMDEDTWRYIDGDGIQPSLCGLGDLKTWKVGKKKAGHLLDGKEYREKPK